jgi:hypothetical protein
MACKRPGVQIPSAPPQVTGPVRSHPLPILRAGAADSQQVAHAPHPGSRIRVAASGYRRGPRNGSELFVRVRLSSLTLKDGTFVELADPGVTVVVGPNNSGKTLLLREIMVLVAQLRPNLEPLKILSAVDICKKVRPTNCLTGSRNRGSRGHVIHGRAIRRATAEGPNRLPKAPSESCGTRPTVWESYQGESRMLDSPEGVCPGQVGFEYPATSVPLVSDLLVD